MTEGEVIENTQAFYKSSMPVTFSSLTEMGGFAKLMDSALNNSQYKYHKF